ncbi:hypothetical protein MPTK1_3g24260 [Marchantia polymorpha subsp. ruderalis]
MINHVIYSQSLKRERGRASGGTTLRSKGRQRTSVVATSRLESKRHSPCSRFGVWSAIEPRPRLAPVVC